MANANLFAQYLQPVRSMQDRMAEYDAADLRREQLAGVQRQNRLQELAFQRGEEERAGAAAEASALRALAQEAGGDESKFAAALRRSGKFTQANEIEKARNERLKGETETLDKRLGIYKSAADQLQDRNQALGWLQSQFNDPLIGPLIQSRGKFEDLAANIPDSAADPEGFDRWRMASSQGLSKVKEQFAPKPVTVNLGGRQVVIDQNPNSPTFGKELQSFVSSNPATDMLIFDPKTGRYVTNEPLVSAKARVAQAGASVTLGSPVPVTLSDGSTVLVQPGNRPGAQPQVVTVGGKPVAPPPAKQGDATEAERNAAGYLLRMEEATKLLDQFEKKGRASYGTQIAGAVPLVGEAARRITMTPEQAQYRQAQEDWVRAKLRKESGASIASDEMEREIATYFPMPGEGPEVVEQKRQARLVANDSFRASAGRAAAQTRPQDPSPLGAASRPGQPTQSQPKRGDVMQGYRFKGGDPSDKANWEKV